VSRVGGSSEAVWEVRKLVICSKGSGKTSVGARDALESARGAGDGLRGYGRTFRKRKKGVISAGEDSL